MQLSNTSKIAVAAAGLVGVSSSSLAEIKHEISALHYKESDGRVVDTSFKYKGAYTTEDENILTFNVGYDALTGATPTGVSPQTSDFTVTSATGSTSTDYAAGEFPLDDGFSDERLALSASWDQGIIDNKTRANFGLSYSDEGDYLHTGVSAGISRLFNNKNTTVSLGLAYAADTVEDVVDYDGVSGFTADGVNGGSDQSKDTLDFIIGVTQILSKDTILQLNYGVSNAEGYLNDKYKQISLLNSDGTNKELAGLLGPESYFAEERPESRLGHNLYAAVKHNFSGDILSVSGRYHTDDFGIDSVTLDAKYRFDLGNKKSIEPHVRLYHQTQADFYTPYLDGDTIDDAGDLPQYASNDYRLAEFDALTVGATYRFEDSSDNEWRVTGEFYKQVPTDSDITFDGGVTIDSNPGLDAFMLSVGVKF